MGTITVRKLSDDEIRELRVSAAQRGVSMEQEARDRLRRPLPTGQTSEPHRPATSTWQLKASKQDILALGVKPARPVDQKAEADALYDYLRPE